MASVEKALQMLRNLPRVGLNNIRDLPISAKNREKTVGINYSNYYNKFHYLFITA